MKTYKIANTDLAVSRIAFGTASLGGEWDKQPVSQDTIADATRIIHTAYDNGITLFDHADIYGFGKSEAAFGEVLKASPGLRSKIVIQSKCGIRWEDEPQSGDPRRMDYSRDHIVSAVEGSLRRLHTEHLDILLLHHPDPLIQPEEVAHAFDSLKREGKVRYFGVSNHTPIQLELLRKYIRQPIITNEVSIGLANPGLITEGNDSTLELFGLREGAERTAGAVVDTGTIDYCRLNGIQVQAYSPLRGVPFKAPPADATPQAKQLWTVLDDLAKDRNSTPASIALAWLLRHPASIVPITETKNPEHLIDNCTAYRINLTREEWYRLWIAALGVPPSKDS
jgi:predicted oxidoreductase